MHYGVRVDMLPENADKCVVQEDVVLFSRYPFNSVLLYFSVCDDIADLSNPKEAANYKKASSEYYKEMKQTADRGEAIHGVLEYVNIVS